MTQNLRHLSRLALALIASVSLSAGLLSPALAEQKIGATSGYLAGQQALNDLRTGDAATFLQEAANSEADNPFVVSRAVLALAADGRVEESAEMAKKLLAIDAQNEVAHLVIATVELKNGQYARVETELANVGTDTFPGLTATILHAWAMVGDGKLKAAEDILGKMSDEGLADFLVFHRALMADVAGDAETASNLMMAAYDADPQVARLVEAYARMLGNAGKFDEALSIIGKFESTGATHPLVTAVKPALQKKERPGKFADDVQSGAAEMFHSIGIALSRDQSADYAAMFLRLGMYLDPQSDIVAMSLAELFDSRDQHDEANSLYEVIPSTSPMKPLATVRQAENLDAMGNRAEAISSLTAIINSRPNDLDAVSVLGDLYRDDERYAEAAATYTKALEITGGKTPADWRFYYVRGIAYERNKEWPKAEADFLKALDLNPDQPQVLNYLGYSWVDKGLNLTRALEMIQKAVSAAPNDGYIIDSLGWAFYRLGRYKEAVQVLEQAVQLLPNDPEINDHLGDAYWRVDRKLEARFQWTVASSMDEKGEVKARVAPKLAGGLDAAPVDEDSKPIVEAPKPSTQASAQ